MSPRERKLFLARYSHTDSGKKYLIESFYRSIPATLPCPFLIEKPCSLPD